MELDLSIVGDPWRDRGLVRLWYNLKPHLNTSQERKDGFTGTIRKERLRDLAFGMIRDGHNQVFSLNENVRLLSEAGRLEPPEKYAKDGFLVTDGVTVELTNGHRRFLMKKHNRTIRKPKQPVWVPRSNFIGMPSNARAIRASAATYVDEFIENKTGKGSTTCGCCGKAASRTVRIHQFENPFFNKHHNTPTRGFERKRNEYVYGCPSCRFLSLLTTLDARIPFVRENDVATLLLPVCSDFNLLCRIWSNIGSASRPRAERRYGISSNMPNVYAPDNHSLLVTTYLCIFNRAAVRKRGGILTDVSPEEAILLSNWYFLEFTKGRNVDFRLVRSIRPPVTLAHHVQDVPVDGTSFNVVSHIFSRIHPTNSRDVILEGLSRALVTDSLRVLARTAFEWSRVDGTRIYAVKSLGDPVFLFREAFVKKLMEVWNVLDEKTREDLKALGIGFGSAFADDVSLLSKLYNATSAQAAKRALADALFRMYKMSAGGEKGILPMKSERFVHLHESLDEEGWKECWDTFLTFTLLSAVNRNVSTGGEKE